MRAQFNLLRVLISIAISVSIKIWKRTNGINPSSVKGESTENTKSEDNVNSWVLSKRKAVLCISIINFFDNEKKILPSFLSIVEKNSLIEFICLADNVVTRTDKWHSYTIGEARTSMASYDFMQRKPEQCMLLSKYKLNFSVLELPRLHRVLKLRKVSNIVGNSSLTGFKWLSLLKYTVKTFVISYYLKYFGQSHRELTFNVFPASEIGCVLKEE